MAGDTEIQKVSNLHQDISVEVSELQSLIPKSLLMSRVHCITTNIPSSLLGGPPAKEECAIKH